MKDLMVFGCGNNGDLVGRLFKDKVRFYIDNDVKKQGGTLLGKSVLSLREAIEYKDKYGILISVYKYKEIAEQLKKCGIKDYTWYVEDNDWTYEAIDGFLENCTDESIALLGCDVNSEPFLRYLLMQLPTERVYLCTKEDDIEKCQETICGKKVVSIDSIQSECNSILITPSFRQTEWYYYCERKGFSNKIINPVWHRKWFETEFFIKDLYGDDNERNCSEDAFVNKTKSSFNAEGIINDCVAEMEKANPLFHKVEIETINRCNLNCGFCPVGALRDPRKKAVMSDELFCSIIDQLSSMDYDGRLSIYSNNEPLMDDRLPALIRYAREKVPKAFHYLVTNGTLLTVDLFLRIIPYLDELVIDNYGHGRKLFKSIQSINDYCLEHPEIWKKVNIVLRRPDEFLSTRGGDAPNRNRTMLYPDVKCTLPWFQLIIRPNGEISTCCSDAIGSRTMGDLRKQTLKEAWYSMEFVEFRRALSSGRKALDKCKYCDAFNLY